MVGPQEYNVQEPTGVVEAEAYDWHVHVQVDSVVLPSDVLVCQVCNEGGQLDG